MESKTTTWKAALVIVLIFITGFLAGAGSFAALRYLKPRPLAFMKNQGQIMRVITRKLDLTDAQRAGVEDILRQTRRDLTALRDEIQPKVRVRLEQAQQQIAALLTDKQKIKFTQLVERRKARFMKMRERAAQRTGNNN
jgi:Spy/CpxP family protein refolding chaperone